jgi:hypothetical protein
MYDEEREVFAGWALAHQRRSQQIVPPLMGQGPSYETLRRKPLPPLFPGAIFEPLCISRKRRREFPRNAIQHRRQRL